MLWRHVQLPRQRRIIDPTFLLIAQNCLNRAKMGVQIETPEEQVKYKRAYMNVNGKSTLFSQMTRALGAHIRSVRSAKGLTQKEFADLFGVSQVAVSNWEKGTDRPAPRILAKLSTLTVNAELKDYFIMESGLADALHAGSGLDSGTTITRPIPLLRDPVAAGTPRATDEREIAQVLMLPKLWFPATGELFALKVAGDSMTPIIGDGYIVIVDTSRRDPRKLVERMVAAREGDGITIKWLRKDGDTYMLVPQHISPRIQVRVMRAEGNFSIVGEVIKWIGQPASVRKHNR